MKIFSVNWELCCPPIYRLIIVSCRTLIAVAIIYWGTRVGVGESPRRLIEVIPKFVQRRLEVESQRRTAPNARIGVESINRR